MLLGMKVRSLRFLTKEKSTGLEFCMVHGFYIRKFKHNSSLALRFLMKGESGIDAQFMEKVS